MEDLFKPKIIRFIGNRFGERVEPKEDNLTPEERTMMETTLSVIADRCYPQTGIGVEQAHVVAMSNPAEGTSPDNLATGILVEFELDDGVQPSSALRTAVEALQGLTHGEAIYMIYGGGSEPEVATWDDRWCIGAFIDLDLAMRHGFSLVQRHADRLGSLI